MHPIFLEHIKRIEDNDPKHNSTPSLENIVIGNEGAKILAKALTKNTFLTELYLYNNRIGDEGAKILSNVLIDNTTIKTLNFGREKISTKGLKSIITIFSKNITLKNLYLDFNNIGDQGAILIANLLWNNNSLSRLYLDNNKIEQEGAKSLANALVKNTSLFDFSIRGNPIDAFGIRFLIDAIRKNGSIIYISLNEREIIPIVERNKRAHNRARSAVLQLMKLSGIILTLENWKSYVEDEDRLTEGLSKLYFASGNNFKRTYFIQMAFELWKTRSDPQWWTPEERKEAGLQTEEELVPSSKRRGIEFCIQCLGSEAKFREESDASRLFCGSYCQWIKYNGAPDLRGKTPEEINILFHNK